MGVFDTLKEGERPVRSKRFIPSCFPTTTIGSRLDAAIPKFDSGTSMLIHLSRERWRVTQGKFSVTF